MRGEAFWALEGSRFGPCPAALATVASALIALKRHENRRLPETSQRNVFTRGLRFAYTRTI